MMVAAVLFAAPALQKETDFRQDDGSTFKGHLKGDEWFNWVQTDDGYVVQYNEESKNYEYMVVESENNLTKLKFSNIKVTTPLHGAPPRKLPEHIRKISPGELGKIWKHKRKQRHPR